MPRWPGSSQRITPAPLNIAVKRMLPAATSGYACHSGPKTKAPSVVRAAVTVSVRDHCRVGEAGTGGCCDVGAMDVVLTVFTLLAQTISGKRDIPCFGQVELASNS